MKKTRGNFFHIAKMAASMFLCLMMLCGSMMTAVAELETYSPPINGDELIPPQSPAATGVPVPKTLLEYTKNNHVTIEMTYNGATITSPYTFPARSSYTLGFTVRFAMQDGFTNNTNSDYVFSYQIPSGISVTASTDNPYRDPNSGKLLMTWSITAGGLITIKFTDDFYAETRNNVEGFVTIQGVVNASSIVDGTKTYAFPGFGDIVFHYPPSSSYVGKSYNSNAIHIEGSDVVIPYEVYVYCYDNMEQVEILDVGGTKVNYTKNNIKVTKGSATGSTVQWTTGTGGSIVINDTPSDAPGLTPGVLSGTYYYLTYNIKVPLSMVLAGELSSAVTPAVADRRNTATITTTDMNGTATTNTAYATVDFAGSALVSVVKEQAFDTTTGKLTFTIRVVPSLAFDKLEITELPGEYLLGGIWTDVTNAASPVTIYSSPYTIMNPEAGKTYTLKYVVDYPYVQLATGLLNSSNSAKRSNVVKAKWYMGSATGENSATTTLTYWNGRVPKPIKVPSNTTTPIRFSADGKYLMDFTVTYTGSDLYYLDIAMVDTLGDYMTYVDGSARVTCTSTSYYNNPNPKVEVNGKTFTVYLFKTASGTTNSGSCGYTYQITYTVELDPNAVLNGWLNTNYTANGAVAKRTNTVWFAWSSPLKSGVGETTTYEVKYDVTVEPASIIKTNNGIMYDSATQTYYTDFVITFTIAQQKDHVTIRDEFGNMFRKTQPAGWTTTVTRGAAVYTGDPRDTRTYTQYDFYDIPAGTYTISYRGPLYFNGQTYTQILADEGARTNTAILSYVEGINTITKTATTTVAAYPLDIQKTGKVVRETEEEDSPIKTTTIDGYTYAMVDWTITLDSNTAMNLSGGELIESLFGRQCYAENDISKKDSFLTVVGSSGYGPTTNNVWNYVGTQNFLQEFTYKLGAKGEKVNSAQYTYTFRSYVRVPNTQAHLIVSNQAIFNHPLFGRYVAIADVEFDWTTGPGIPPVIIHKKLTKVDQAGYNPNVAAHWKITIPITDGRVIKNAIVTDYMNYWTPDSFFNQTTLDAITVKYADGTGSPVLKRAPYIAQDSDGVNRVFIEFRDDLTKTVEITMMTLHGNTDAVEKAKKYINFADLEYTMGSSDYLYYSVDEDYWSLEKTDLQKEGADPRYDATLKKYVIDWTVTLEDMLRPGLTTRIVDTLPEGLTLLPTTVSVGTASEKSVSAVEDGVFTISFKPSEPVTVITFSTSINDDYLGEYHSFINKADLLVRDLLKTDVAATSSARVDMDALRELTKSAQLNYNQAKDRYEITWNIHLDDMTRKDRTVYLNERLPDGVTFVAGSLTVTPNRLNQMNMAPDGKSFKITLNPASGGNGEVDIQFVTAIDDAKLTQANTIYAFINYVDLLADTGNVNDVIGTAEAICNISGGVRTFNKTAYAHFDSTENKFLIDWTVVLEEQARIGRKVTLRETLPAGLTLGTVTATAGDGSVPIEDLEIKNVSGDGRNFDITFTPTLNRTVIKIRTYINAGELDGPGVVIKTYTNKIDLISQDGTNVIDHAEATVDLSTQKTFTKSVVNSNIAYDDSVGKYVIHWKLNLKSALTVGQPLTIVDTLPAGLTLLPTPTAVTCEDTQQPEALSYTYNPVNREVTISLTQSLADTTLYLHTSIDDDRLFYTGSTVPSYLNPARVVELSLTGQATAEFGLKYTDVLTKAQAQVSGTNVITYTVDVNSKGIDLDEESSEIVLTDTLNPNVTMMMDTVKVFNSANQEIPPVDYQVQYDTGTRVLSIRLPDRQHLKLVFQVLLNGTPGSTVTMNNTIHLTGTVISATTTDQTFTVQEVRSGVTFTTDYVKIHKFDQSDTTHGLENAKFELYLVNEGATQPSQATHVTTNVTTELTDADGILYLPNNKEGLLTNRVYYIKEVTPPSGYLADTTLRYFLIPSKDATAAEIAAIIATYPGGWNIRVSTAPQFEISNIIDLKNRVIVKKVAKGGTTPLSGAVLQIRDAATGGNLIAEFTSGSVQTVLDNLKVNGVLLQTGRNYYLVEVTPPAGYKPASPKAFSLTSQTIEYPKGTNVTVLYAAVTMEDDPSDVTIRKENMYGKTVAGAVMEIIDQAGAVVTTFTSTATSYVVKALAYDTVYGLREKTAPTGYIRSTGTIWFKIFANGSVAFVDDPIPSGFTWPATGSGTILTFKNKAKLEIKKLDDQDTHDPVIGAVLELFAGDKATGTPIDTWTTDGTPHVVEKSLAPGKYTVHEKTVPNGYESATDQVITITGTETDTISVTMTDKKIMNTSITVTKVWSDAGNQDGYRPASIKAQLKADGTVLPTKTVTLSSTNNWTYTWTGIPLKDPVTKQVITYTVDEETTPTNYIKTITGNATTGFTITNAHTPDTVVVNATKNWADNNNIKGYRPTSITLQLMKNGVAEGTAKTVSGPTWQTSWTGLPRFANGTEILYTVAEPTLSNGYTPSVTSTNSVSGGVKTYTVTINNTFNANDVETSVTVIKTWDDASNQDGIRPASVQVHLLKNGSVVSGSAITLDGNNSWTHTWTELAKKDSTTGNTNVYTVDEVSVPTGYTKTISGTAATAFTIKNSHTPDTVVVNATKTWADNNDIKGYRPTSITLQLMKNGVAEGTAKTVSGPTWQTSWTGLPRFTAGTENVYTVAEPTLSNGYTPTVTSTNSLAGGVKTYTVTINNTFNANDVETSVTVIKTWDDASNQDGIRPASVQVHLLKNGSVVSGSAITLDGNNSWTHTWTELAKKDSTTGNTNVYTVDEVSVPTGYTKTISGTAATAFTIKNTHTPDTVVVNATKTWADNNDSKGYRPDSITLQLMKNGVAEGTAKTVSGPTWQTSWTGLPRYASGTEILYTVAEPTVAAGYTPTVTSTNSLAGGVKTYTVTINNTFNANDVETSVTVIKAWNDANNQDGKRPTSISVQLLKNDVAVPGSTVTLNDGNSWTHTWTELAKKDSTTGNTNVYTVDEVVVPSGYTKTITGTAATAFTITNSHTPETVVVNATKNWADNNNSKGYRPDSITLQLLKGGVAEGAAKTLNDGNSWQASWTDLPRYASGAEILYTVAEPTVPTGYTATVTSTNAMVSNQKVYTVTVNNAFNANDVETCVTVVKCWSDAGNQDGIRPASVQVQLMKNGVAEGAAVTLDGNNSWTHTWTELPKKDSSTGNTNVYTVDEVSVPTGYTKTISGSAATAFTITNTHTPDTVVVNATKNWADNGDIKGYRPISIYLQLMKNGVAEGAAKIVNDGNSWLATWTGLPRFTAGTENVYTIAEPTVANGYTPTVTSTNNLAGGVKTYTVTVNNAFNVDDVETSVTVTKAWNDANNQDGKRSTSIDVQLFANGTLVPNSTTALNSGNSWTHTWTELPKKNKLNEEITYTVDETSVPAGYTKTISGDATTGFTITNAHTPETIDINATKTWADNNNAKGYRPTSVSLQLMKGGVAEGAAKTLNDGNSWQASWTGLPRYAAGTEIVYTVAEPTLSDGYTATVTSTNAMVSNRKVYTVTVNNAFNVDDVETSVTVTKAWSDASNQDGKRPASIDVQLLRNGTAVPGSTVTLNSGNSWTHTWTELPKKDTAGNANAYTVDEVSVPTGYTKAITGNATTGFTITNSHTPETVRVEAIKNWADNNNVKGYRPLSVSLQLMKNGVAEGAAQTINLGNSWQTSWSDLPRYAGGIEILYTVAEPTVAPGYTPSVTSTNAIVSGQKVYTVTINNTFNADEVETSVTVCKVWNDNNNQDGIQPASVQAQLLADGSLVPGSTVTLDANNRWTHTWTELPKKNGANTIVYTVDEVTVPTGYTKAITGTAATSFTITNTHVPAQTDLKVKKVWVDNEPGTPGGRGPGLEYRPASITVQLQKNGVAEGAAVTLSEANTWQHTWPNMPVKANGSDITYTVEEVTVPAGYASTSSYNDATKTITVTNTLTLADVVVNKYRADVTGATTTTRLAGAKFEIWRVIGANSTKVVSEFSVGATGYPFVNTLVPGSYLLKETSTPVGYYPTADVPFTVTTSGATVNAYDPVTVVAISKVGKVGSVYQPLPGAELAIFDNATETDPANALYTFTTTTATQVIKPASEPQIGNYASLGSAVVVLEGVLEAGKTYYLREITAPSTYLKASKSFQVSPTAQVTSVELKDEKIELMDVVVNKVWDDLGVTGVTHPDVVIDLYRSDAPNTVFKTDTLLHTRTSLTFSGLYKTDPDGLPYTYTVKERPADGYYGTITGDMETGFTLTNTRTTITVKKIAKDAAGTSHFVPGATLQIWTTDATPRMLQQFTSGTTAELVVGKLAGDVAGITYELREVGLPVGFVQATAVRFTVSGPTCEVELVNKPTLVVIQKVNERGDLLPNARLKIMKGATQVWSGTTGSTTQIFTWNNTPLNDISAMNLADGSIVLEGILEEGVAYQLVETYPPSGYKTASPVNFTTDTGASVKAVSMTDIEDDASYEIAIYKKDQYGDLVSGARLTLKDTVTGQTWTWTTTETNQPYKISLPASVGNRYQISEVIVPEDYQAAATISFAVNQDAPALFTKGGVTLTDNLVDRNIRGTKTWVDRGAAQKPITINLYRDDNPNVVYQSQNLPVGTTTYAFLHLPAVDASNRKYVYTVKEAPVDGYSTVQTGNDFTNTATKLTIRKVDENDQLLGGVELGLYDSTNQLVGATWNTTTTNPKEFIGELKVGATYTLREVTTPLGYKTIAPKTITIADSSAEVTLDVVNEMKTWQVSIRKVATNGGTQTNLPGATLGLYANGSLTPTYTWNTSTENPKVFTNLDPRVSYMLMEITPPTGFLNLADVDAARGMAPIIFTVDSVDASGNLSITMSNLQTKIEVNKLTGTTHLAGAVLEIRDAGGTPVRRWTSNGSTHTVLGLTPGETYTLHEVKPPAGYATNPKAIQFKILPDGKLVNLGEVTNLVTAVLTTDIPNPLSYDGFNNPAGAVHLDMVDDALNIKIQKLIAGTTDGLAGATLELYKDSVAAGNLVETWVTTTSPHAITAKLEVGKTYILHEKASPTGYQCSDNVSITIADTKNEQLFTMEDPTTKVTIEKRDALAGNFVPGATLTLTDNVTRQVVQTWVTDTAAKVFDAVLIAGRSYTLTETKTPDGYYTATPITFNVELKGENAVITMIDAPSVVRVIKMDEKGQPLSGVSFTLTEKTGGRQIATWVTDGTPKEFRNVLVVGRTYLITETDAPIGYGIAQPREFTVPATVQDLEITITDHLLDVQIRKVDKDTGLFVPGVVLELYEGKSATGAPIDRWTTTGAAHKPAMPMKAGAWYTLHEVSSIDGYVLPGYVEDVTFQVDGLLTKQNITFENVKIKVAVTKLDQQTGVTLAGAVLRIVSEETGNEVAKWTSKTTPEVISGLIAGKWYMLEEVTAPTGFALGQSVRFQAPSDTTVLPLSMQDPHIYRFLKVDSETGAALSGARLRIEDENGVVVVPEWSTTGRAYEVIGTLEPGKSYVLAERLAPYGYKLAPGVPFTVPANGYMQTITIRDEKIPTPTNPPPPTTISLRVTKTWDDYNNAGGKRPASITLDLFRKLVTDAVYPTTPFMTVSMTGGNTAKTWTFTFQDLPRASGDVRYDYMVREQTVDGYQVSYANNGASITNYLPDNPNSPTPTPFATPTPGPGGGGGGGFTRQPVGVRYVDGQWVYIDENDTPLGVVPLTGDDTDWLIWGAAIIVPLLVAALAAVELRKRKKRSAKNK